MANILIADDDRLIGSMVSYRLTNSGYRVVQAYNGEEACNMAAAESPDVILLDIMMPIMDGFHVLQHLKDDPALRRIPVIMLTALGREKDVVGCLKAGAADFVVKPFNLAELAARVTRGKSPSLPFPSGRVAAQCAEFVQRRSGAATEVVSSRGVYAVTTTPKPERTGHARAPTKPASAT